MDIKSDDQRRRFEDAARALGCDEDEAAFKEKLGHIARQKPKDQRQPPARKRDKRGE